jgi:hypothetical protein
MDFPSNHYARRKPLEMSMFSKTFEVIRDLVEIAMITALVYGGWALLFWC